MLDRKLEWLAEHAEFAVTINTVLGADVRHPEDALTIAQRARALGFNSTAGILHDGTGQTKPLPLTQIKTYEEIRKLETSVFKKHCAPHCSISCVHQVAMLDDVRAHPREMLTELIARKKNADPAFEPPFLLKAAAWAFLDNPKADALGKAAAALLRTKTEKEELANSNSQ